VPFGSFGSTVSVPRWRSARVCRLARPLRRVADASWGRAVLVAVAIGLLAYGAFCLVEARYRRVGSAAGGTA